MAEPRVEKIQIKIDKESFTVQQPSMSGNELRNLVTPPIAGDRDLWLTVPGPTDDFLVESDSPLELKNGMHFYTAPSTINPGTHAPGV